MIQASDMLDISLIIGFRDWGLDRLALALRAHGQSSFEGSFEVVVSDYGSDAWRDVEAVTRSNGGVYVRTEVDGPWSRARALNAGIASAQGRTIITTDSDLLFSPAVQGIAFERLMSDPKSVQLLQCRDLSRDFGADSIDDFDWEAFERHSLYRPRWGMGGMIAFRREALGATGGYDERMEVYGGEDIDFAQRLRWAGYRANWIDDPRARIFHVWHASSREQAQATPDGDEAIKRNSSIMLHDKTVVRNVRRAWSKPLATVAIPTYNRAHFLPDCLYSVLSQPVDNIEVVVVDDGSDDETEAAVAAIGDERVRYVRQSNAGVAAARNRAVAEARAAYLIIQDDDDLMLPWRIEAHFDALTEGVHGSYGGCVDFDNETGELAAHPGKPFSTGAVLFTGAVLLHATIMLRREFLVKFPYNELFRGGSDYNLALRLANAGASLNHSGEFHILRRLHEKSLTRTITAHQQESARRSTNLFRRVLNQTEEDTERKKARGAELLACTGQADLVGHVKAYLPDTLVRRVASFDCPDDETLSRAREVLNRGGATSEEQYAIDAHGDLARRRILAQGVGWPAIHRLRLLGVDPTVEADLDEAEAGAHLEEQLIARVKGELAAPTGLVAITYCVVGTPATDSLWNQSGDLRGLYMIGARQYIASASRVDGLAMAVESVANGAPPQAGAHALIVDFGEETAEPVPELEG